MNFTKFLTSLQVLNSGSIPDIFFASDMHMAVSSLRCFLFAVNVADHSSWISSADVLFHRLR